MKPALTSPSFQGNRVERIRALVHKPSLSLEELGEVYKLAGRVSHNRRIKVDDILAKLSR